MLKACGLCKCFAAPDASARTFMAVDDVSLTVADDAMTVLVGESGSGKSTLAKILAYIMRADAGHLFFDDHELSGLSGKELRPFRKDVQLVMQNAVASLDPHQSVRQILEEPMKLFFRMNASERACFLEEILDQVQLDEGVLLRRPGEFSGGQQKRICMARALAARPRHIIFDESFSGLDATIKKQILVMLKDLRKKLHIGCLIITHDMDTALFMADTIHVMQQGSIIETVEAAKDFSDFNEPYSKELVRASLFKRMSLY